MNQAATPGDTCHHCLTDEQAERSWREQGGRASPSLSQHGLWKAGVKVKLSEFTLRRDYRFDRWR